jgi:hypothetical protein
MSNTEFIVHEKSGVSEITLSPCRKREELHYKLAKLADGALVLGFVTVFVGLVLLLAK